jgi:lipid A oxidase
VLRRASIVAGMVALTATPAHAEWLFGGYVGAGQTRAAAVDVTPAAGGAIALPPVSFSGHSFEAPIYYGYRVGWKPARRFAIEAEFTHAKAIAGDTGSAELTALQFSHGLNFALANLIWYPPRLHWRYVEVTTRAGAGITIPHVEATFRRQSVSSYQFGGAAGQAGAGVAIAVARSWRLTADVRLTYANVAVNVPAAELRAAMLTAHVNTGIEWHLR